MTFVLHFITFKRISCAQLQLLAQTNFCCFLSPLIVDEYHKFYCFTI